MYDACLAGRHEIFCSEQINVQKRNDAASPAAIADSFSGGRSQITNNHPYSEFSMSSSFFCCDLAKYSCGLLALVAGVGIIIGCGGASETVPAEGAAAPVAAAASEGFGAAIGAVEKIYTTIDEGKGDGSDGAVHGAMHNISGALQKLALATPALGDKSEEANTAISRMGELYDNLDKAQHGEGEASYDDMSAELKELMEKLKSLVP